ncbi:unnamed protein product, partial [Ectocarpus sp. 13 AM-2016]
LRFPAGTSLPTNQYQRSGARPTASTTTQTEKLNSNNGENYITRGMKQGRASCGLHTTTKPKKGSDIYMTPDLLRLRFLGVATGIASQKKKKQSVSNTQRPAPTTNIRVG